jgi:two-component system chemotaxis response regulator CheB
MDAAAVDQIVVIGTSTGGLHALRQLIGEFPSDLQAAVFVTMHIGNNNSALAQILAKSSSLPVEFGKHDEQIKNGHIYVAPPDHHLLVERSVIQVVRSAKENYCRPAIDPMFRSAAISYQRNAIGVILTGQLDDGVTGLEAVKAYGGMALVQDPDTAEARSMPHSALRQVEVDACLPLHDLAEVIVQTVKAWAMEEFRPSELKRIEPMATENDLVHDMSAGGGRALDSIGDLSGMSCPECGGALWQLRSAVPRFRCHTGHSYNAGVLAKSQDKTIEEAIWIAIRALHEKQILIDRLAARGKSAQLNDQEKEYEMEKAELESHKTALRALLVNLKSS